MRFCVLPVLAPALLKGLSLRLLWETCKEVGVACCDALLREGLGYGGDQLQQRETSIDVARALAGLVYQRRHVVARQVEQALKTLCLLVWVHVDALRILDQLPFQHLCIINLDDAGRDREKFCKLRRAKASRSRNHLKALRIGAHGDGLNQSVVLNALGQLLQLDFVKGTARIGGGLVDGVDGEVLECAAVLHDGPPWAG